MSPQSTILLKEARSLFWPWCGLVCGAALPLFLLPTDAWFAFGVTSVIYRVGFWVGLPLLAAMSLGNEFQHRTFALLLSQPVSRMKILQAKHIVLAGAAVSLAAVYAFTETMRFSFPMDLPFVGGAWLVISVCSAAFWTLITRSTIGGLALNLMQFSFLLLENLLIEKLLGPAPTPQAMRIKITIISATALCYGAAMLWLGRRKLAEFQDTGAVTGDDLLMSSPRALRGILTDLLQCRPTGAVLNLIRKEIRLLWPVWGLTGLCLLLMICVMPFQFIQTSGSTLMTAPAIAGAIVGLYAAVVVVLAGCLSMGEERTWGTHSWHLTEPLSADLQWFLKWFVAVCSTVIGLALTVNAGIWMFGEPFYDLLPANYGFVMLLLASGGTFAAFWCACGVKGTVRAAMWTILAVGAITMGFGLSNTLLKILAATHLAGTLVERFHSTSFNYAPFNYNFVRTLPRSLLENLIGFVMILPALVTGVFQSRRAFRRDVRDGTLSILRYLMWPVIATFVFGFCLQLPQAFLEESWYQLMSVLSDVHQNVRGLQLDLTGTDEAHPRQLTKEDVDKLASSERSRRWLEDARISVFRGPSAALQRRVPSAQIRAKFQFAQDSLNTNIHLANGLDCMASDFFNLRTGAPVPRPWLQCKNPNSQP